MIAKSWASWGFMVYFAILSLSAYAWAIPPEDVAEPSPDLTPSSGTCLVSGQQYGTFSSVEDEGAEGGLLYRAKAISQNNSGFEGDGYRESTNNFPALAHALRISIDGDTFWYPNCASLNRRIAEIGRYFIRFQTVNGEASGREYLVLLADGKMPYSSHGESHYHDLQIHLFGSLAAPRFWWEGVQGRAKLLLSLANHPAVMGDPAVQGLIRGAAGDLINNVELVTSRVPSLAFEAWGVRGTPQYEAAANKVRRILKGGNSGSWSAAIDSVALSKKILEKIDTEFKVRLGLSDDQVQANSCYKGLSSELRQVGSTGKASDAPTAEEAMREVFENLMLLSR